VLEYEVSEKSSSKKPCYMRTLKWKLLTFSSENGDIGSLEHALYEILEIFYYVADIHATNSTFLNLF
jgi:hypothetical protein